MLNVSKTLQERDSLASTYGEARLEPATLDGIPGIGTMQVVRTVDGEILEFIGTWRLVDDGDAAVDGLADACAGHHPVRFEGRFSDPLYPDGAAASFDVRIVSARSYLHHVKDDSEAVECTKTFYRLEPEGALPEPYAHENQPAGHQAP